MDNQCRSAYIDPDGASPPDPTGGARHRGRPIMEHLMLGLGDLTGLDIIAAAEHPSFATDRSDAGRARLRPAAVWGVALRGLGFAARSDGRCRADAGRGRSAPRPAGAPRADCA